jgi:transcription initiation factor TFIIB
VQAFTCLKCRVERTITDPESGEIKCSLWGLLIEDKIEVTNKLLDNGLSGRFSASYYDIGQSTIIGDSNRDAKGQIQSLVLSDMQRLRTWNYRIQQHDSKERNLKKAFSLLNAIKR